MAVSDSALAANDVFAAVAEAAIDDLLRLRPDLATSLGDHSYDHALPDLSESGVREVARVIRGHRERLAAIDDSALDAERRVDSAMLSNGLDLLLFHAEQSRDHLWDPLSHDAAGPIHTLLSRDTWPLPLRLDSLAARLRALPEFLATARRTVTDPPRIHVETALARLAGLRMLVTEELNRAIAPQPGLGRTLAPLQEAALRAADAHEAWLRGLLEGGGREPRLGAELFLRKLPLLLCSAADAEQILDSAWANIETQTHLLWLAARQFLHDANLAADGSSSEVIRCALDVVSRDVPTDDTLLGLCQRSLRDATAAARSLGRVTVPDDEVVVQVMPEHRRGVSVAYCEAPGALESGGETFVAVSPAPSAWPSPRVASYYREYNVSALHNLMVHEAMPGHVLQLAHARRFRGATRVRQVFSSGTFVEGWAVHCEQIMAEAGYGGLPVRMAQLKIQLRMTLNAILDFGVHAGDMTRAEAVQLMSDRGFQEEGEALGKWQRALLTSGQLSTYFVGYLELAPFVAAADHLDPLLAHGRPAPRYLADLLTAART